MNRSTHAAQLAVVVAAHVALLAALLAFTPTREAMMQIIPVVASIVSPGPVEPPAPPAPERKAVPKPDQAPAPEAKPVAPAAAQVITAAPSPAPALATAPISAASSAPVSTIAAPSLPAAASAPASALPFTPPRVDAAYLDNPKPEYPAASLQLGEAGRVVLNVSVSAAGTVEQASVRTSSGSARLDQAALKAVRQWRFVPARRGGEAVAAQVLVPISFKPENE